MDALSAKQVEALRAVEAGRVQYGAEHPTMARRSPRRNMSPAFLLDGYGLYAAQHATYDSLAARALIVERIDLLPHVTIPEKIRTDTNLAGYKTQVIVPAHQEPEDPGWRAEVQLTDDGRAALHHLQTQRSAADQHGDDHA